jgi:hypothetical protein
LLPTSLRAGGWTVAAIALRRILFARNSTVGAAPIRRSGQREGLLFNALAQLSPQTSASHQINGNAQQILQRQLEVDEVLNAGAGWEVNQ